MARELPRTLQTLSHEYQKGMHSDEYEIIIVDNGSSKPFEESVCKLACENIRFIYHENPTISPVRAINKGVGAARAENICIMIDGARMASPGLLRSALDILSLENNNIVGSLAFHLGEMVQTESIKRGYNQEVEDKLLNSVDWQGDGYKLFDISVFAGSSSAGWFTIPLETNALFMHRSMWKKLGGYDEQFVTAGGGMSNQDFWRRACHLQQSEIFMLLGEGTFHQFHGGVATNSIISKREEFNDEYKRIRGEKYSPPSAKTNLHGSIEHLKNKSILDSAYKLITRKSAANKKNGLRSSGRSFDSNLPAPVLSEVQSGVLKNQYRSVPFFKSPFDISLYLNLLAKLAPKTVIEIGTKNGGSALWFADMLSSMHDSNIKVISIDATENVNFEDSRISFLAGDANSLEDVLSSEHLIELEHPWLIIEDSSRLYQHSLASLNFFHNYLQKNDYIVVEGGIVSQMSEPQYKVYENGPNRAVHDFLAKHSNHYKIDTDLCDHFGKNVTYNPNGYLKRI